MRPKACVCARRLPRPFPVRYLPRALTRLLLIASLLAMTACSPACTPPEAKNPDAKADSAKGETPQADPASASGAEGGPADVKKDPPPVPKGEMIMEAKGVDLSKLKESQRSTFFQIINSEPSACDKPHSLAKSLRDDDKCRDSLIAGQFVADYLQAGAPTSEVRTGLQEVSKALKPREIPVEGRPVFGSATAPVTVVVFADFQCPHCKLEAPKIRKTVEQFRGRARLIFKHFPLMGHPRAKAAAIATEAALEQDKFWEMHDIVFANQDKLEDGDIRSYASKIGLDMAKFDAHYNARKGKAVVEADKQHGEDAGVDGTPAVFVNGRRANGRYILFGGELSGWIDDALKR